MAKSHPILNLEGDHVLEWSLWRMTTQREVFLAISKISMEEPMIMDSMTIKLKKMATKKRSENSVETLLYEDLMDINIPTFL